MKRLATLTLITVLMSTSAFANGAPDPCGPEPKEPEKIENAKASGATSLNTCDRPTSVKPVGYAADAETWPCRNFSK